MKEQIVSFETAKLAKEKGFDKVWCNNIYCVGFNDLPEDKEIIECDLRNNVDGQFHLALAPTQSLLQRWLREKHKIHIDLWYNDLTNKWRCECLYLLPLMAVLSVNCNEHPTYEEALEEGLYQALKLIKDE
jgi:hypothetical protein